MHITHIPVATPTAVSRGEHRTVGKLIATVGSERHTGYVVMYRNLAGEYELEIAWPIKWAVGIAPNDKAVIREWMRLQAFYVWQVRTFNLC